MTPLETLIRQQLQTQDLAFADFMQLALYQPQFGYYSAGLQKFGPGGDFITAPELSPLFGKTLAKQCQQVLQTLTSPIILEFGAGSGRLCIDMMKQLEELDSLPEAYHILELSSSLRQRQQEAIRQEIPKLATRIHWLDAWPKTPISGVMIANEVLDAMPVHRFLLQEGQILESYIHLNDDDTLSEQFHPCQNQRLLSYLASHLPQEVEPYLSEVNLFVPGWIAECHRHLAQGLILLIDYGFPRHEYYHKDRRQGTLMCHHQHHSHPDPLWQIGEQDITAHVDFTQVAEAAVDAGFEVAGFTNQAAFLLANGILDELALIKDDRERFAAQQAVKRLLNPHEMGELFKVMALCKGVEESLTGFQWQDKRWAL